MKFVCGQPLVEQYCFNFTWKSVKIEPILFLKISDLDMSVFVLFYFLWDTLETVCILYAQQDFSFKYIFGLQ